MKMNNKKLKKTAISNLVLSYLLSASFLLMLFFSKNEAHSVVITQSISEQNETAAEQRTIQQTKLINPSEEVFYQDKLVTVHQNTKNEIIKDNESKGFVYKNINEQTIYGGRAALNETGIYNRNISGNSNNRFDLGVNDKLSLDLGEVVSYGSDVDASYSIDKDEAYSFERASRRLKDLNKAASSVRGLSTKNKDKALDFSSLSVIKEGEDIELGDPKRAFSKNKKGYSAEKGGELYAYNFPSKGIGAGVGSAGIGAGGGAGAGLGAGIGEGVLNGEVVPTLGGVGTSSIIPKNLQLSPENDLDSDGLAAESGGVGGLTGGAGAGAAAGLTQGYVLKTPAIGVGAGAGSGGGYANKMDFKHLPKDGNLFIMMHVDGSGSILKTRKQLEIMKNTLLKKALLPYYNNDESLYSKRVIIVDGEGERTLKFFSKAAEKDNVLAFVFQDEAQPDYHLPNFNKKPEEAYEQDLNTLKSGLLNHKGLFRGVMFQVGEEVFSKSFKEFVENAWQGQGYLSQSNLKKYYWQENRSEIQNKTGIVFSDEYHAKDNGTPEYYLDLIFNASKKVGINLDRYKGGLTDGNYIKQ